MFSRLKVRSLASVPQKQFRMLGVFLLKFTFREMSESFVPHLCWHQVNHSNPALYQRELVEVFSKERTLGNVSH